MRTRLLAIALLVSAALSAFILLLSPAGTSHVVCPIAKAAPLLQGTSYNGIEFPQGDISFADRVLSFTPGPGVGAPCDQPSASLGPPDYDPDDNSTYVALGNTGTTCQGELILEFVDNYLVDVDGDDLYVFEIGPMAEATDLYISTDGSNWISIGRIQGATRGVDISRFARPGQRFPYVRLCDHPDGNTSSGAWSGPDIDAVGAIGAVYRPPEERTPRPEPDEPTPYDDEPTPYGGQSGGGQIPGEDRPTPPFGSPEPTLADRMTLQAGQRRVLEGGLVYVPVWLVHGRDVANINFTVDYDGDVAMPEGELIRGSLLDRALFEFNPAETDLIRIGFAQTTGIYGTGTVTYIPFRAVGRAGDWTELHLEVTTINDPGGTVLAIDRIDGAVYIVGPGGLVPGDCNNDGALTQYDAACALQISVRLRPVIPSLDMDGSGEVTSRDATIILQRATRPLGTR